MAMNPEVKAKWLEALRGNEYVQAQKALRTKEGFCCLGVLCDLHSKTGKGKWEEEKEGEGNYRYTNIETGDIYSIALPTTAVSEWAGLGQDVNPDIPSQNGLSVAELNDLNFTFAQIADIIEKEL